jgi:hypothetical protein
MLILGFRNAVFFEKGKKKPFVLVEWFLYIDFKFFYNPKAVFT